MELKNMPSEFPGGADDGVQGSHIWENELEEGGNLWSARIFLTVGI